MFHYCLGLSTDNSYYTEKHAGAIEGCPACAEVKHFGFFIDAGLAENPLYDLVNEMNKHGIKITRIPHKEGEDPRQHLSH